jgi:hypothetical protein
MIGTAQDTKQFVVRAQAIMRQRQTAGTWRGGILAHTEYQTRPLEWITTYLGVPERTLRWSAHEAYQWHDWDGTLDPLVAVLEGLAEGQDVGVESGTGVGKTYLAACITYWFLACFEDSIISTIAPKEGQLLKHVWKEIGNLWPQFKQHFPQAELLPGTGVIRMKPQDEGREKWAASAFVCGVGASEEVATKAQGLHAEHMLLITEETPGIHPAIMEALYNTRTDDHNIHLALGNPDHRQDELHKFCEETADLHVRMSALDHPNIVTGERIVPGAIGRDRLAKRIRRLGKGTRLYESRVRGISPMEASDALIRWEWCTAAAGRYSDPQFRQGTLALGADVAQSSDGDFAAIARWQGACLTEVQSFRVNPNLGANDVAQRVFLDASDPQHPVDPRYIAIDTVGVGASTVNELRRLGLKVRHLSGGRKAVPGIDTDTLWSETEPDLEGHIKPAGPAIVEAERFDLLRSQVWWRMREDLRLGRIALPNDEELFQDLTTPTYTTLNGKIVVESKEKIMQRLRRSPDKGDAACYGNFVRRRTPLHRQEPDPATTVRAGPNRDVGLEGRVAQWTKQHRAQERDFQRRLRQWHRNRRVGR